MLTTRDEDITPELWWWVALAVSSFLVLILITSLLGAWCCVYHPCDPQYYTNKIAEEENRRRRERRLKERAIIRKQNGGVGRILRLPQQHLESGGDGHEGGHRHSDTEAQGGDRRSSSIAERGIARLLNGVELGDVTASVKDDVSSREVSPTTSDDSAHREERRACESRPDSSVAAVGSATAMSIARSPPRRNPLAFSSSETVQARPRAIPSPSTEHSPQRKGPKGRGKKSGVPMTMATYRNTVSGGLLDVTNLGGGPAVQRTVPLPSQPAPRGNSPQRPSKPDATAGTPRPAARAASAARAAAATAGAGTPSRPASQYAQQPAPSSQLPAVLRSGQSFMGSSSALFGGSQVSRTRSRVSSHVTFVDDRAALLGDSALATPLPEDRVTAGGEVPVQESLPGIDPARVVLPARMGTVAAALFTNTASATSNGAGATGKFVQASNALPVRASEAAPKCPTRCSSATGTVVTGHASGEAPPQQRVTGVAKTNTAFAVVDRPEHTPVERSIPVVVAVAVAPVSATAAAPPSSREQLDTDGGYYTFAAPGPSSGRDGRSTHPHLSSTTASSGELDTDTDTGRRTGSGSPSHMLSGPPAEVPSHRGAVPVPTTAAVVADTQPPSAPGGRQLQADGLNHAADGAAAFSARTPLHTAAAALTHSPADSNYSPSPWDVAMGRGQQQPPPPPRRRSLETRPGESMSSGDKATAAAGDGSAGKSRLPIPPMPAMPTCYQTEGENPSLVSEADTIPAPHLENGEKAADSTPVGYADGVHGGPAGSQPGPSSRRRTFSPQQTAARSVSQTRVRMPQPQPQSVSVSSRTARRLSGERAIGGRSSLLPSPPVVPVATPQPSVIGAEPRGRSLQQQLDDSPSRGSSATTSPSLDAYGSLTAAAARRGISPPSDSGAPPLASRTLGPNDNRYNHMQSNYSSGGYTGGSQSLSVPLTAAALASHRSRSSSGIRVLKITPASGDAAGRGGPIALPAPPEAPFEALGSGPMPHLVSRDAVFGPFPMELHLRQHQQRHQPQGHSAPLRHGSNTALARYQAPPPPPPPPLTAVPRDYYGASTSGALAGANSLFRQYQNSMVSNAAGGAASEGYTNDRRATTGGCSPHPEPARVASGSVLPRRAGSAAAGSRLPPQQQQPEQHGGVGPRTFKSHGDRW